MRSVDARLVSRKIKMKIELSKLVQAGLFCAAVTLGVFVFAAPARAADAPSNLTVDSHITHLYNEFSNTTQITIERGGWLEICTGFSNYTTINADITFSSDGSGDAPRITLATCMGGDPNPPPIQGATFNGDITLQTDGSITTGSQTLVVNGSLTHNGHNLAIVTQNKSRILGVGRVGSVSLSSESVIAPGQSPGILSTGNLTFVSGSTYEFELGGTTVGTEYDQIDVTGTVDLGSGTLQIILYDGFKPTAGQSFTIINNDGADAITGTFAGLPEGGTLVSEGYAYTISYVGGDGNDVVLTAIPTPPDTGFSISTNNPFVVIVATVVAVATLVVLARRLSRA